MRIDRIKSTVAVLFVLYGSAAVAQDSEIESLREAIQELRTEYESRIDALERRLAVAEQVTHASEQAAPPATPVATGAGGKSAFNPAIGVIFQGNAWAYEHNPDDYVVPGFPFGGEAGPIERGLSIGETEINISANVDDKFTAWLTTPVVIEDGEAGIEIEEAWIETTALPVGFAARVGRFYSGIGYLNSKHQHAWDFADQPLPYQALLGDQYLDDGVQIRWIAPTDLYMEFGAEILNGSRYPAAGSDHSGFGAYSLFANVGGDVGTGSSWLAGVSYLDTSATDRPSGPEDDPYLFTGDASLATAHFVWKWAPNGNWKQKNFIFQAEYLWRNEDGIYTPPSAAPLVYDEDQQGWYAQAVYQPFPRWRFGGRIDGLVGSDPGAAFAGTLLAVPGHDPLRYTVMADWSNSEFSRLRLQYTRDDAAMRSGNQWGLQYIFSIGAHGAHTF